MMEQNGEGGIVVGKRGNYDLSKILTQKVYVERLTEF
jgi:hypothetical protein